MQEPTPVLQLPHCLPQRQHPPGHCQLLQAAAAAAASGQAVQPAVCQGRRGRRSATACVSSQLTGLRAQGLRQQLFLLLCLLTAAGGLLLSQPAD
jgi:hypothetical protein